MLLMQRVQNEAGRASRDLPDALAEIAAGLKETRTNPLEQGQWYNVLWMYNLLTDDHVQAKAAAEAAVTQLHAARADPGLLAEVLGNLSYSMILLGEVASAKSYVRQAVVLATQQSNRRLLANLYCHLGDAHRKTGQYVVSRRYFEAAHELDEDAGDLSRAAISEAKLGSLAREGGEPHEAVMHHRHALEQFDKDRNYWQLVTHIELARDYADLRNLPTAEKLVRSALSDRRALPEQRLDASILLLRLMNDRRERSPEATWGVQSARDLVVNIRKQIDAIATRQHSILARPTHQLQFQEQALRHFAMNGDLHGVNESGRVATNLARRVALDLRNSNDDSLAWLTVAQPVINEYVRALYSLDRARVLPLLETYYDDALSSVTGRRTGVVDTAFQAREVTLFERYRSAEQALVDINVELSKLRSYARGKDDLIASITGKLQVLLRERDLARDAYLAMYRATPPSALLRTPEKPWQPTVVPKNDVVVRYFIQERVSFAVAIAGSEVEYVDLPARSKVRALVRAALAELRVQGLDANGRATLAQLAPLLPLEFLARHPHARRLVIIPDDSVDLLPFAAVNLRDRDIYDPLIKHFEVLQTRSASRYYAPASRPESNGVKSALDIFVVADPVVGPSPFRRSAIPNWSDRLEALPSSREEAASIERIFALRTVKMHLGAMATREAVLSSEARSAKILHIATHGYFSDATPDMPGLAVASPRRGSNQGFLGVTDLFQSPFASRLVVISGCDTMRGRDYSGWGVRSIADAFLAQGAGAAIGTLWGISDVGTAALMESFYRNLLLNDGRAATALRAAQLELRDSAEFADPYFWAGLVLQSSNAAIDQAVL